MVVSLAKGGNVSLTKSDPGLKRVKIGLGWDIRVSDGADFDLDSSCFLLKADDKVRSDSDFIFYNNKKSACGSVTHNGDNTSGAGDGDDETIDVELAKVPPEVMKVLVAVTIHDASTRKQNFGMIRAAYVRVLDADKNTELARYDLSEDASVDTSMMFGELYRKDAEWKFRAVGQGFAGGLGPMAQSMGVNAWLEIHSPGNHSTHTHSLTVDARRSHVRGMTTFELEAWNWCDRRCERCPLGTDCKVEGETKLEYEGPFESEEGRAFAELGMAYSVAAHQIQKGGPAIFQEAAFVAFLVGAKTARLSVSFPLGADDREREDNMRLLLLIDALLRQSWGIFDTLGLKSYDLDRAYADLRNQLDSYLDWVDDGARRRLRETRSRRKSAVAVLRADGALAGR